MNVFVCMNAFGRRRKRRPPSSSSIAGSPQRSSAGRFVTSAGRSLTDQWIGAHLGEALQHLDEVRLLELLAGCGDELDERLARVAPLAHDQMAQIAAAVLLRVRRETFLARPVAHRVADAVAEVGREPALADVDHLVPAAGAV